MWPFGKNRSAGVSTGVRKSLTEAFVGGLGDVTRIAADGSVAVGKFMESFQKADQATGGKLTEQLSALGGSRFEEVEKRLLHALNEMRNKNREGYDSIWALINAAGTGDLKLFTRQAIIFTLANMSRSEESLENDLALFASMEHAEQVDQLTVLCKKKWMPKTWDKACEAFKGLAGSTKKQLGEAFEVFKEFVGEMAESDHADGDAIQPWVDQTARELEEAKRKAAAILAAGPPASGGRRKR